MKIIAKEFEMKDMGESRYIVGLELDYNSQGIILHQQGYIAQALKKFGQEQAKTPTTPLEIRSIEPNQDIYGPRREGEELLSSQYSYLELIGTLNYAAKQTRPDISFALSLLARSNHQPTLRHWNAAIRVLRYLQRTKDFGLLYRYGANIHLEGYADAGYQSDLNHGKSQNGYCFFASGAVISWNSTRQSISATSSNHSEILALHEASRECVWLRDIFKTTFHSIGDSTPLPLTRIYEDNASCIYQMRRGCIYTDRLKHVSPKFFFTHDLIDTEIELEHVDSASNVADIFTKTLGPALHNSCFAKLGLINHLDFTRSSAAGPQSSLR